MDIVETAGFASKKEEVQGMAETIFGLLYQAAMFVLGILSRLAMWLLGSFFEEKLSSVLEDSYDPKKKLERQIGKLQGEHWFNELEADYRYGYIIWNNGKVEKYLSDDENISLLLKLPEAQMQFAQLVKGEHRKFVDR